MDRQEFRRRAHVDWDAIDLWVDAEWLAPRGGSGEWAFSEIDLARTRLIQDLAGDLGVNDEGIPIILGLIDQLHGMRRALGELLIAVRAQPTNTRKRFAAELRAARRQRESYVTLDGSERSGDD